MDLRMVDTSDFMIAYCPTNIYSVGTPHEIIMATLQHKPVLFVSPPIVFPALHELRAHLADDPLHVVPDPEAHTLRVTYDTNQLALKNLEGAIASAGYQANDTAPCMGGPDSPAVGWTPIWIY